MATQVSGHNIRTVRFPIKGKLISVITFLILSSLSIYAYYALDHFKKDKSAYIYETSLNATEGVGTLLLQDLANTKQTMTLLSNAFNQKGRNKEIIKNIFDANPNIVEFSIFDASNRELIFGLQDGNYLKANSLSDSYFLKLSKKSPLPFEKIVEGEDYISSASLEDELTHLLIARFSADYNQYLVARLKLANFIDLIKSNSTYKTYVLNSEGQSLIGNKGFKNKESYRDLFNSNQNKGVREIQNEKGESILISFQKSAIFNLLIVSEIQKNKAFSAAEYIVSRSVYFALFLISFSVITGILFSRNLTAHVEKLHRGIVKVSGGDFNTKVKIESKDEIGALSDSFNFMSGEILRYMDEMKEKIRLEKEVEIAQLVQSSFFPPNDLKLKNFDIAAYYTPASECGGDWWGYIEKSEKLSFFIADATGHGVPAALLTATANSSLNFIKEILKTDPELIDSPAKMMSMINRVVCSTGNTILMTFFIATFDKKTKQLVFANASHNPPFRVVKTGDVLDKSSFLPLMSPPGPHLGKDSEATYSEERLTYDETDQFLFFTDGILECSNPDSKPYGQRRFIKSLISNLTPNLFGSRDGIVKEAFDFYSHQKPDDDITFIALAESSLGGEVLEFSPYPVFSISQNSLLPPDLKKVEKEKAQFFLLDASQVKENEDLIRDFEGSVVVISDWEDDKNILELLDGYKINHIIGANSGLLQNELAYTFKGIIERGDKKLTSHFGDHSAFEEVIIKNSKTALSEVKELLSRVNVESFFDSPINYLESISNELVSNAVYNASGNSKVDRTSEVSLDLENHVHFRVGKVNNNIVISVIDNSGLLTREKIVSSLARSAKDKKPEEKEGGAGLGLYMILGFSNQLIIKIENNKSTEVTCIIEDTKRYRQYRSRVTSFHYFEKLS